MRRSLTILAIFAGILVSVSGTRAGDFASPEGQEDLSAGKLLVANEKLSDPAFAQSVVLIVSRDSDHGTLGLMINHRSDIPLSKIFSSNKGAGNDPVYIGGPVELTLVQALIRSPSRIGRATHVLGDVYNTADKDAIERGINGHSDPAKFRLYLGYAGWGPGQLESEMRLGAWSVMNGSASIVFDNHPDSLWSRLNAHLHMQIVQRLNPLSLAESLALR
jgi:putative transcriptional regulator